MTDPLRQFIIFKEYEESLYFLKVFQVGEGFTAGQSFGRIVASHRNIAAIRVAIPPTHVKADVPVEAPIVEVWIDKSIAEPFGGDRFVHV